MIYTQKPNKEGFIFCYFLMIVALAIIPSGLAYIAKKGINWPIAIFMVTSPWAFMLGYVPLRYRFGERPNWTRFFCCEYLYQDVLKRFFYNEPKKSNIALKDTAMVCVVNIFGGVGWELGGFYLGMAMAMVGYLIAWLIGKHILKIY